VIIARELEQLQGQTARFGGVAGQSSETRGSLTVCGTRASDDSIFRVSLSDDLFATQAIDSNGRPPLSFNW